MGAGAAAKGKAKNLFALDVPRAPEIEEHLGFVIGPGVTLHVENLLIWALTFFTAGPTVAQALAEWAVRAP